MGADGGAVPDVANLHDLEEGESGEESEPCVDECVNDSEAEDDVPNIAELMILSCFDPCPLRDWAGDSQCSKRKGYKYIRFSRVTHLISKLFSIGNTKLLGLLYLFFNSVRVRGC